MPRPRKVIRSVSKHLHLPEDLVGRVELELFSPLEGRVPQSAWQVLCIQLLEQWVASRQPAQEMNHDG